MHPPSFFPKRGRGRGKMRKKKQGSRGAVVMWEGRERVYTHILAAAAALASDGGAADLSSFLSFSFSFSFRGKSAQGRPSLSSPRGQKRKEWGKRRGSRESGGFIVNSELNGKQNLHRNR